MQIIPNINKKYGIQVTGFDVTSINENMIDQLKSLVYKHKIVVLKNQDLNPSEYVSLGNQLGKPEAYYQPMYHHPEEPLIFVSSNVAENGRPIGVPRTGKFWHGDYSFMQNPFAFTMIYPQLIPAKNRGTYFIDMAEAFENLSDDLKQVVLNATACHSVRKYFKIRPSDVYRPLTEVINEVENETPAVFHPAVFRHPITQENILYVSEGFTQFLLDNDGNKIDDDVLSEILKGSGQLDDNCDHGLVHFQTFEKGDLLIWDNRRFIHRAMHAKSNEASMSFRLTLHDEYPFYSKKVA